MTRLTVTLIAVLLVAAGAPATHAQQADAQAEKLLASAQHKAMVDGDLKGAIEDYKKIIATVDTNRRLVGQALVRMAECYQKLGDAEAQRIYERVVREFGDQNEVASQARRGLASFRNASATSVGPVNRQIWSGVTTLYATSPSSDGRYLSFTDFDSGDLAVRDLREGTSRRLTNKGGWTSDDFADLSLVSPDGRQVAYAWFDGKTFTTDLRVVPVSGDRAASPKIVHRSDETSYIVPSAWTPDGKSLLVVRTLADRTNQIALISISDGSARALKSLDWRWPSRVSLSPDGRYIAYDVPAGDDVPARDIFVLAVDGSRETVVVQHRANDHSPLWSPDGTHIVFLSDRTGNASLWTVPVDAGKSTGPAALLRRDVGQFTPLGMTRGGTLYYVAGGSRKNVYIAELDRQLKVMNAPVLATERYVNSNSTPAWSPDGQYLAYLSQRWLGDGPGSLVLVVRSRDGEERDVPMRISIRPRVLRWFPDGRSVLVASRDLQKSRFVYYRVDVATGETEVLHYTRSRVRNGNLADLSADGNSIVYVDSDAGSGIDEQLMRFDIATGRETVLDRVPGAQICSLALSPDGNKVAYLVTNFPTTQGPSTLEVIPSSGGEARVVFQVKTWGAERFNGVAWTPDSRHLLFVRPENAAGGTQAPTLWRLPVAGGEPETLNISLNTPAHPDVHPDGNRLAFEVDEPATSEVWALERFLPKPAASRR